MGLAHRIIPTLLCKGRQLVKGERFEPWRSVGLAVQGVRINAQREVDELVLLDVAATREGRTIDPELVAEISDILYSPLAVGGGIRTIKQVKQLLRAGADKVVIGTGAIEVAYLIKDIAEKVGNQAVVAAIDVRRDPRWPIIGTDLCKPGCWIRGGTVEVIQWPWHLAQMLEKQGAGEILLTSVDREGTMRGYDLDLIQRVQKAVRCPLIAHGGAGTYEHLREGLEAGASAVAAGAMFQFTEATPKGAARYLAQRGVEVRI